MVTAADSAAFLSVNKPESRALPYKEAPRQSLAPTVLQPSSRSTAPTVHTLTVMFEMV